MDDDDAQERSKFVPFICRFDTWRRIGKISYKTQSFVVY